MNALRWLLLLGVGAIPLVAFPGPFFDGFATPRQALAVAWVLPLALLAAERTPGALPRIRLPVLALGLTALGGFVPHVLGHFDANALAVGLCRTTIPLAFVVAGAALSGSPWRSRLVTTVAVATALSFVVTVGRRHFDLFTWIPDRLDVAPSGLVGNSNALAEVFAPLAAAGLARLAAGANAPFGAALVAGCGTALVFLSRSRGGALAFGVGAAVAAAAWILTAGGALRARRAGIVTLVVALAALFVTILPQAAPAREALASVVDSRAPTNRVRLGLWQGATELAVAEAPTGVGMGRFESAFLPYRTAEEWGLSGADTRADDPHQEFLRAAAEGGVLGLAGLALFLLLGIGRGLKATRQGDPAGAPLVAAGLALLVTACVRSPFSHAGGTLAFGLLLGATGIAPPDVGRLDRIARGVAWALAIPGMIAALVILADDRALGNAVGALNDGKAALANGDAAGARDALRRAGRAVSQLPGAPLKDPGRTFRAALAADDLEHARIELAAAGIAPEILADFPDGAVTDSLIAATRRAVPGHAGCAVLEARRAVESERIAAAVTTLRAAIDALPNAPRLRRNLAAVLLDQDAGTDAPFRLVADEELRFGGGPDLAVLKGRATLEALRGRPLSDEPSSKPSIPLPEIPPGDRETSLRRHREQLLAGIAANPDQGGWLAALAETDYTLGKGTNALLAREANRAFARSRLRFAIDADSAGDRAGALRFLRLALRKDDGLRAARELAARWGEPVGDPMPVK